MPASNPNGENQFWHNGLPFEGVQSTGTPLDGGEMQYWHNGLPYEWMFPPSVTAAVTGTATASITETDVVTGGKTIIITLTGDTWVTAGATFDGQRQNIINGIDSAQAEATGWDAVVKATQGVGGVVRTSATVVTITLDAQATYNITAQETITVTIPATALTGGVQVIATPTFTVSTVGGGVIQQFLTMLGVGS